MSTISTDRTMRTTATFGVRQQVTQRAADTMKEPAEWEAVEVRDYVVRQISSMFGVTTRKPPAVEMSIFRGFCSRWGAQAGPIAVWAFTEGGGRWNGAPVRVERFCKNSDPHFAKVISGRLSE